MKYQSVLATQLWAPLVISKSVLYTEVRGQANPANHLRSLKPATARGLGAISDLMLDEGNKGEWPELICSMSSSVMGPVYVLKLN